MICIKRKGKSRCSVAPDVAMSGFPRTLTKNQKYALIPDATVPTGENHVRESKRGLSRAIRSEQWLWFAVNGVELGEV